MRAFVVSQYKEPLQQADVPEPVVGEHDVLVQVRAAGLNVLDEKIRAGEFRQILPYKLPQILGNDVAGTVIGVGAKVQGFRLGADDYVVKPVGVLEFLARVEALLRRTQPRSSVGAVRVGQLEIDGDRRSVSVAGDEIELSPLEFDLLTTLAQRHGSLVSRAELLKEVWGYRSDVESRTVDTHIAKLRSKIDRGDQSCIVTVRKRGYRLR